MMAVVDDGDSSGRSMRRQCNKDGSEITEFDHWSSDTKNPDREPSPSSIDEKGEGPDRMTGGQSWRSNDTE